MYKIMAGECLSKLSALDAQIIDTENRYRSGKFSVAIFTLVMLQ